MSVTLWNLCCPQSISSSDRDPRSSDTWDLPRWLGSWAFMTNGQPEWWESLAHHFCPWGSQSWSSVSTIVFFSKPLETLYILFTSRVFVFLIRIGIAFFFFSKSRFHQNITIILSQHSVFSWGNHSKVLHCYFQKKVSHNFSNALCLCCGFSFIHTSDGPLFLLT